MKMPDRFRWLTRPSSSVSATDETSTTHRGTNGSRSLTRTVADPVATFVTRGSHAYSSRMKSFIVTPAQINPTQTQQVSRLRVIGTTLDAAWAKALFIWRLLHESHRKIEKPLLLRGECGFPLYLGIKSLRTPGILAFEARPFVRDSRTTVNRQTSMEPTGRVQIRECPKRTAPAQGAGAAPGPSGGTSQLRPAPFNC
jgi:hypothetical protein